MSSIRNSCGANKNLAFSLGLLQHFRIAQAIAWFLSQIHFMLLIFKEFIFAKVIVKHLVHLYKKQHISVFSLIIFGLFFLKKMNVKIIVMIIIICDFYSLRKLVVILPDKMDKLLTPDASQATWSITQNPVVYESLLFVFQMECSQFNY